MEEARFRQPDEWEPLEPVWAMLARYWKLQFGLEHCLRNHLPMFTGDDWTSLTAGHLRTELQGHFKSQDIDEFVKLDEALHIIQKCVWYRNCIAHAKLHYDSDGEHLWGTLHQATDNGVQDEDVDIDYEFLMSAYTHAWLMLHLTRDLASAQFAAEITDVLTHCKICDDGTCDACREIEAMNQLSDEEFAERYPWLMEPQWQNAYRKLMFPAGLPGLIGRAPYSATHRADRTL